MRHITVKQPVPDQTIINNILAGDTAQFNELVLRHKDYAYSLALKVVHSPEDAEEIAHDAFLKAFKALKSFNQQAKFTTWLYRIVFNTAISHTRKKQVDTTTIDNAATQQAGYEDSSNLLRKTERKAFVQTAMARLSPIDASLISLFYLQELNLDEIGQVVGLKASAVKVKLFRARKRLARELEHVLPHEMQTIL